MTFIDSGIWDSLSPPPVVIVFEKVIEALRYRDLLEDVNDHG